jgi:hypothetical protein
VARFPAKIVPELIAYAKANPGKISMASAGIGSGPHVAGELFKMMAGADMVHVPYRGDAPALTDLIGGQVQLYFSTLLGSIEYIKTNQLRALAVTTATRSDALPSIPTVADFLPGFEASFWAGVGAPRNAPAEIIDKLNNEINAGLADPKIRAQLADLGGTPLAGSPPDFGKLIAQETEKWGKVVKFAGIKPNWSGHLTSSVLSANPSGPLWVTTDKTHSEYKESACPSDSGHSSGRRFPPLGAITGSKHYLRFARGRRTPDEGWAIGMPFRTYSASNSQKSCA